jgi:hypothetical protein
MCCEIQNFDRYLSSASRSRMNSTNGTQFSNNSSKQKYKVIEWENKIIKIVQIMKQKNKVENFVN